MYSDEPRRAAGRVRPSLLTRLRQLRAARADPARIGDAGVLQSELLGGPMSAKVRTAIEDLLGRRGPETVRPALDEDQLRRLPKGSVGRALSEFYRSNDITPATISDQIDDERLRKLPAIARYICFHDLFHVLLGCDTSIPGELRITAFIIEQGYFKGGRLWLPLLYLVGLLVRPHLVRRTYEHIRVGRALARRAPMLLAQPLEDILHDDLGAARRRLNLVPIPA